MSTWEERILRAFGDPFGEQEPDRRRTSPPPKITDQQQTEIDQGLHRARSDLRELRERHARDEERQRRRIRAETAAAVLPALEDLDRVLLHAAEDDPVAVGVRLAVTKLEAGLAELGAVGYDPLGEQFDPEFHEAVASVDEQHAAGTVTKVLRRGWTVDGVVLVAAQVIVQQ